MTVATAFDSLILPTDETPIREAALLYARAGFSPVPIYGLTSEGKCRCGADDCVGNAGKHPIGAKWQKRATSDVDATRELFAHHAGNIGIVVGAEYVVIDVDYYHGGAEGLATLPEMPVTLTSRSGSGKGEHRVFRYAAGQDPREVTNRPIAQGVDVKTNMGQIVAAPSWHVSGGRYQWLVAARPALLPPEVYERIRKPNVTPIRPVAAPSGQSSDTIRKRAERYMAKIPAAVSKQGGHAQTFAAARVVFGWIQKGLDESDGWGLLVEYNQRCDPPWAEKDLRHKFDEARKAQRIPVFDDAPQRQQRAESVTPAAASDDWRERLIYTRSKSGPDKLAKHHENAVVVLRYAPEWRGRLAFDEHAYRTIVTGAPWTDTTAPAGADSTAREWTDTDSARLSSWIKRNLDGDINVTDCERAVQIAAEANRIHPFRSWLDSLIHDGKPRLDSWLSVCLGAARGPYTSQVGAWWLISAAARTYSPGCQAHHVLVLEGAQGIRKSSALRTLAGEQWFSDTPIDLHSKDAYLALQGRVIIELGELGSLRRADEETRKVFFTSATDRYRQPYGRREVTVPRGCVFAGTVNHGVYLTDDSGNRRYWPIRCGAIDLEFLASVRDQLWAEARERFKAGGRWWPVGPDEIALCSGEQSERKEEDPWEDAVLSWCDGQDRVGIADVWKEALKEPIGKLTQSAKNRISSILRPHFVRRQAGAGPDRGKWFYVRLP